jgi:hypothetical protein
MTLYCDWTPTPIQIRVKLLLFSGEVCGGGNSSSCGGDTEGGDANNKDTIEGTVTCLVCVISVEGLDLSCCCLAVRWCVVVATAAVVEGTQREGVPTTRTQLRAPSLVSSA